MTGRGSGGLRFRRRRHVPEIGARVGALAVLLLLSVVLLVARGWWLHRPPPPASVIVEVRGDVPMPGYFGLDAPARVHDAVRAAGGDPTGIPDAALEAGTRVVVSGGGARLEPMDELLVVGLPIDVNSASVAALVSIPGIGASKAEAIVAERESGGTFERVEDLERVKGIGPATVEAMRPFVTVGSHQKAR